MQLLTRLNGGSDYAERSTVTTSRQSAGITMREHSAGGRHQRSAMASHGFIGSDILHQHFLCFVHQIDLHLVNSLRRSRFKVLLLATDRPKKVHLWRSG